MYKLISEFGNEIAYTESEQKRDRLLRLGFRLETQKQTAARKGANNEEGKSKNRAGGGKQ